MSRAVGKISLRQERRGGDILNQPDVTGDRLFSRSNRATLLVHGFNVTKVAANQEYRRFFRNADLCVREECFWLFWPGDVSDRKFFSTIGYPINPDRAVLCAQRLAKYIITQSDTRDPAPKHLRIIAHSLGCRLALELAERLSYAPRIQAIDIMVLMAAAVPRYMVAERGKLDIHEYGGQQTLILRSIQDSVLTWAFRLGQRLESSGPRSFLFDRGALGRRGLGPLNKRPDRIAEIPTNLGHGDYWRSKKVAKEINFAFLDQKRRVIGRSLGSLRPLDGRRVEPRVLA